MSHCLLLDKVLDPAPTEEENLCLSDVWRFYRRWGYMKRVLVDYLDGWRGLVAQDLVHVGCVHGSFACGTFIYLSISIY